MIAAIAVLVGFTVAGLGRLIRQSKIKQAREDIANIINAIYAYKAVYSRFPISPNAEISTVSTPSVNLLGPGRIIAKGPFDFTFGTVSGNGPGVLIGGDNLPLPLIENTIDLPFFPRLLAYDYKANNSEVIAILSALDRYRTPGLPPTPNRNHARNPQKIDFLQAKQVPGIQSPGVGDDLVFRDPWGNPYIITISLTDDHFASDAFYRMAHVSEIDDNPPGRRGTSRLVKPLPPWPTRAPTAHWGDRHFFKVPANVVVWSFGPDGKANYNWNNSPNQKADQGDNKDNILSWEK